MVIARLLGVGFGCLALAALVGCGSSGPTDDKGVAIVELRLGNLAGAYGLAQAKLGRTPKTLDEIKPFYAEIGVTDTEAEIISPIDNQPFVLVAWPKLPSNSENPPIIAHEKTGGSGRHVVRLSGAIERLSDAEFQAAEFPPGHVK